MDNLEIIAMAAIRDRATHLLASEFAAYEKKLERSLTQQEHAEWDAQNPPSKYIRQAYDELGFIKRQLAETALQSPK